MSLFGQKKLTLNDILKGISALSDEDKARLERTLYDSDSDRDSSGDGQAPDAPQPENTDSTTDDGAASPADAEQNGEQQPPEAAEQTGAEGEQPPETAVDAEQRAINTQEPFDALSARMQTLEESFANLLEKYQALAEAADNKPFGSHSPELPEGSLQDGEGEDSRIMRSYMAKQTYRK